ncbi:hypothetical protein QAO71_17930 (plasmid) [Halopseudomonas sp. SMJS2]|uniref:hypothetical protein n=1 Tax=Halopseudomonas sp. SMJS2 TaxID=3041098 RepID=UPI0024535898|nr:hypothetical protein [Halopseudomonas sp. SMJS2]WGK63422.1 hypothetical protein QAO71_17930 [Halopseudomonas sp. SMJS2]
MPCTANNTALEALPVQFSLNVPAESIPAEHILMNAPRPLFGKQVGLDNLNHGRYYALLDLGIAESADLMLRNSHLHARVVVPVSKDDLVDLVLLDHRHADRYRELETCDLFSEVSHLVDKLQCISYERARAMLARTRQLYPA